MNSRTNAIEKILSRNDTGETGGHQAGILIPKDKQILSFFPGLNNVEKNPRLTITFHDHMGEKWPFSFIYYNNKFFGGTRNEYRLTGMTKYIHANNLKSGDILTLFRDEHGTYSVKYQRESVYTTGSGPLKLSNTWKVVKI